MFEALAEPSVPCDVAPTRGAFYFFLRVHSSQSPLALAERLIREHLVAVMPGSAFGDARGCSIRVSYGALDAETAHEGLRRLIEGLRMLA
jgi:aspartate/methionine/tyrosine aminotransferase